MRSFTHPWQHLQKCRQTRMTNTTARVSESGTIVSSSGWWVQRRSLPRPSPPSRARAAQHATSSSQHLPVRSREIMTTKIKKCVYWDQYDFSTQLTLRPTQLLFCLHPIHGHGGERGWRGRIPFREGQSPSPTPLPGSLKVTPPSLFSRKCF